MILNEYNNIRRSSVKVFSMFAQDYSKIVTSFQFIIEAFMRKRKMRAKCYGEINIQG